MWVCLWAFVAMPGSLAGRGKAFGAIYMMAKSDW